MRSRVSTAVCLLALAVTLWVAALHRHAAPAAPGEVETAGCVYCSGGYAAASPIRFEPMTRLWVLGETARLPEAPVVRTVLPLAHSGNAPPS